MHAPDTLGTVLFVIAIFSMGAALPAGLVIAWIARWHSARASRGEPVGQELPQLRERGV